MRIVLALVRQIGGKRRIGGCGRCRGMPFAVAFA
jgi:hypothetical protein